MRRLTVPRTLLAAFLVAAPGAVLPASPAEAATHQVLMSGYAFSPRSLTITAGDTVTWTNQDQAPHDVKTTSGPASVHSPMLNKGGSWSHTFTTAGTYGYVCTVHPDMTAQLVVKPAAAPAPTQHQHHHPTTSAPTQARTTRPATSAEPSPHMSHSEEPSSAEAAVPASRDTPSPSASAATQPASIDAQAAASAARPLDPLLLLTGVIAGVAVLCLLLVGSRAAARGEGEHG